MIMESALDCRAGIPLRSTDFYSGHRIELLLNTRVVAIDPRAKSVALVIAISAKTMRWR